MSWLPPRLGGTVSDLDLSPMVQDSVGVTVKSEH